MVVVTAIRTLYLSWYLFCRKFSIGKPRISGPTPGAVLEATELTSRAESLGHCHAGRDRALCCIATDHIILRTEQINRTSVSCCLYLTSSNENHKTKQKGNRVCFVCPFVRIGGGGKMQSFEKNVLNVAQVFTIGVPEEVLTRPGQNTSCSRAFI